MSSYEKEIAKAVEFLDKKATTEQEINYAVSYIEKAVNYIDQVEKAKKAPTSKHKQAFSKLNFAKKLHGQAKKELASAGHESGELEKSAQLETYILDEATGTIEKARKKGSKDKVKRKGHGLMQKIGSGVSAVVSAPKQFSEKIGTNINAKLENISPKQLKELKQKVQLGKKIALGAGGLALAGGAALAAKKFGVDKLAMKHGGNILQAVKQQGGKIGKFAGEHGGSKVAELAKKHGSQAVGFAGKQAKNVGQYVIAHPGQAGAALGGATGAGLGAVKTKGTLKEKLKAAALFGAGGAATGGAIGAGAGAAKNFSNAAKFASAVNTGNKLKGRIADEIGRRGYGKSMDTYFMDPTSGEVYTE